MLLKDFTETRKLGRKIESPNYLLWILSKKDLNLHKVGIIVSKKVSPLAHTRNRLKRITRQAMRNLTPQLKNQYQIVIVGKTGLGLKEAGLKTQQIEKELKDVFVKTGIINEENIT